MTQDQPNVAFCPVAPERPFTPCGPAELGPLLDRLASGAPVKEPATFPRGTLLPDGRLDLCKQQIGPAGAIAVAAALRGNPHVSAVLLGADGIGDAGAAAVADLLGANARVHTAYLGCNGIGPAGVRAFADAVDRGAPLAGLWLKRNPIGDEGAMRVARLLERNPTIRTLDLVNTEMGEAGLRAICAVLADANRTVRRVYLGGNGIGPRGAADIARVVARNPGIKALLLNANRLGDAGAVTLARALRDNRSLEVLGLAANGIGPDAATSLFEAVSAHPALLKLDLGYCASAPAVGATANRLGDAGAVAAAAMLRHNRVLRELDLRRNGLSCAGVAALVEAVEQNPALCRLTLATAIPQPLLGRLRRAFTRNRAAAGDLPAADPDVLAIRSVYRS